MKFILIFITLSLAGCAGQKNLLMKNCLHIGQDREGQIISECDDLGALTNGGQK